jgi:predicted DNA-binding protein (MmcQ/YjbR family)
LSSCSLGTREIGHLHGDRLLDVPFPKRERNDLVAAGLARPHHILPESGWVSFFIEKDADVDAAIALLRRSHDLVAAQLERRAAQSAAAKRAR